MSGKLTRENSFDTVMVELDKIEHEIELLKNEIKKYILLKKIRTRNQVTFTFHSTNPSAETPQNTILLKTPICKI